jgi:hypothetical protein
MVITYFRYLGYTYMAVSCTKLVTEFVFVYIFMSGGLGTETTLYLLYAYWTQHIPDII